MAERSMRAWPCGVEVDLLVRVLAALLVCSAVGGCATPPGKIEAAVVSASVYDPYDCPQIKAELVRVQGRLQTVIDMQGKQASRDKLLTSAFLFSPAFTTIMLVAGKDLKREVSVLKGEFIALNEAAKARGCPA
jgi:hypothetical protein